MSRPAALWGLAATAALHGSLGAAVFNVDMRRLERRRDRVEIEVRDVPPPPPEVEPPKPEPPPPPPPPPPRPRRLAMKPPAEPPSAPPPPNQEPPPEAPADPAPPVFGVTLDSTVEGTSAVAVPVGNTLMTPERKAAPAQAPKPYAAVEGPASFSPVPQDFVKEWPRVLHEVRAEDQYPSEAKRLGLGGQVILRVGIDRRGAVRAVRVIQRAGHGFDEAATKALWQFKFSPARAHDGQAVDFTITYKYTFQAAE